MSNFTCEHYPVDAIDKNQCDGSDMTGTKAIEEKAKDKRERAKANEIEGV